MRGYGDQDTKRAVESIPGLPDVPRGDGRNWISAVFSKPRHQTGSVVSGYIYAYDRGTGRFQPHWVIPGSTTYRVIAVIISAIGVAIGVGIFLAECLSS
jgi:hypothetical protein